MAENTQQSVNCGWFLGLPRSTLNLLFPAMFTTNAHTLLTTHPHATYSRAAGFLTAPMNHKQTWLLFNQEALSWPLWCPPCISTSPKPTACIKAQTKYHFPPLGTPTWLQGSTNIWILSLHQFWLGSFISIVIFTDFLPFKVLLHLK